MTSVWFVDSLASSDSLVHADVGECVPDRRRSFARSSIFATSQSSSVHLYAVLSFSVHRLVADRSICRQTRPTTQISSPFFHLPESRRRLLNLHDEALPPIPVKSCLDMGVSSYCTTPCPLTELFVIALFWSFHCALLTASASASLQIQRSPPGAGEQHDPSDGSVEGRPPGHPARRGQSRKLSCGVHIRPSLMPLLLLPSGQPEAGCEAAGDLRP